MDMQEITKFLSERGYTYLICNTEQTLASKGIDPIRASIVEYEDREEKSFCEGPWYEGACPQCGKLLWAKSRGLYMCHNKECSKFHEKVIKCEDELTFSEIFEKHTVEGQKHGN